MSSGQGKVVEKDPGGVAAFGPFRLFPTARLLERDGVPVDIGGRALDILIELVNQAGRVVSKADLMSTIWADPPWWRGSFARTSITCAKPSATAWLGRTA
jgi:DNA-binding response OmpR family regulator